jgi:hypothetical protein
VPSLNKVPLGLGAGAVALVLLLVTERLNRLT